MENTTEVDEKLTAEKLSELQNAVIDPRFHEFYWRTEQNWIGDDLGYGKKAALASARPEDLPSLVDGLLFTANRARSHEWLKSDVRESQNRAGGAELDPVVLAAMAAFGFVFIRPFLDGNGRIHRILAYSTPFRPLIPRQAGHPFHAKPAADSTARRPPIPRQSGH